MNLINIRQKIYEVRGVKVMLDFDLAVLYEVETRSLNQSIKRNLDSFPNDFMFRLTQEEWQEISSSQIVMIDAVPKNRGGKYLPYAFTEHGVTMLASVLKSPTARKMNIAIVRAFIGLKKWAIDHSDIIEQLEGLKQRIGEHDIQLNQIYDAIENLLDQKVEQKTWENRGRIGFRK
ncbi:MAG TPA: DNA-binding protein [Chitinophagaceae bacterium]|nr:DNA-binding protein [Chitinophagaceae bacterium]